MSTKTHNNPVNWDEQEHEILNAALKAYYKRGEKQPGSVMQHSENACTVGRKYVYIRNGAGLLAKYDFKAKEFVDPRSSEK